MIYTIEKRNARCEGSMVSWYEVRSYTHITPIGILANGETLTQTKTKKEAKEYCKEHSISVSERSKHGR